MPVDLDRLRRLAVAYQLAGLRAKVEALARFASVRPDLESSGEYWRCGGKVGRTVYRVTPDDPEGTLIGVMDTPELARLAVDAVNQVRHGVGEG